MHSYAGGAMCVTFLKAELVLAARLEVVQRHEQLRVRLLVVRQQVLLRRPSATHTRTPLHTRPYPTSHHHITNARTHARKHARTAYYRPVKDIHTHLPCLPKYLLELWHKFTADGARSLAGLRCWFNEATLYYTFRKMTNLW